MHHEQNRATCKLAPSEHDEPVIKEHKIYLANIKVKLDAVKELNQEVVQLRQVSSLTQLGFGCLDALVST